MKNNTISFDWSAIDTVLLDMDGTLLDLHFDNYFWLQHIPNAYAKAQRISLDKAQQFLYQQFNAKRGSLSWYCVDYWSQTLALDILELKQEADVITKIQFRPQAQQFLRYCQATKKNIALITNAHRKVFTLKHQHTRIGDFFDFVSYSHELGFAKEQADYWDALIKIYPFDPQKTVFIDDSEAVLHSAATFGIAHLFSIAQPDSTQKKQHSQYALLQDFAAIMR